VQEEERVLVVVAVVVSAAQARYYPMAVPKEEVEADLQQAQYSFPTMRCHYRGLQG
jgi:hypothetical protein